MGAPVRRAKPQNNVQTGVQTGVQNNVQNKVKVNALFATEADMPTQGRTRRIMGAVAVLLAAVMALATNVPTAPAQGTSLDDLVSAVVRIKTFINPDGRSVTNLGREREGSG